MTSDFVAIVVVYKCIRRIYYLLYFSNYKNPLCFLQRSEHFSVLLSFHNSPRISTIYVYCLVKNKTNEVKHTGVFEVYIATLKSFNSK